MKVNEKLAVCIIGAESAGLAAAYALKKQKLPFLILEKHKDVGGIWDMEKQGSLFNNLANLLALYLKAKDIHPEKTAAFRERIVSKPFDISSGLKFEGIQGMWWRILFNRLLRRH